MEILDIKLEYKTLREQLSKTYTIKGMNNLINKTMFLYLNCDKVYSKLILSFLLEQRKQYLSSRQKYL